MKKYILSHDFGTSADKVVLFCFDGTVIKSHSEKYKTYSGPNGESEQNPNDWWIAFCKANEVILKGIDANEVAVVAIDGTDPNLIMLDENGNSLYNSIMWNDSRCKEETIEWNNVAKEKGQREIIANTKIAKILWMQKHHGDILAKAKILLSTNHSYIIYRLCHNAVCDTDSAIDSGMYDKNKKQWDIKMLNELNISIDRFPKACKPTEIVGEIDELAANECHLVKGIPLIAGYPDASSAAIGTGAYLKYNAVLSAGTSAGIMYTADNEDFGFKAGTFTVSCGSSYNWVLDTLLLERDYAKAEKMIQESPVGAHGIIFIPYLSGERSPYNNPFAKGSWCGLTMATNKNDLVRSAIEGIIYNLYLFMEEIRNKGYVVDEMTITGGFSKSDVICQMIADIMNVKLQTIKNPDFSASIGSAVLGGVAIGIYEDLSVVKNFIQFEKTYTPNKENVMYYSSRIPLYKQLYEQLVPIYSKI